MPDVLRPMVSEFLKELGLALPGGPPGAFNNQGHPIGTQSGVVKPIGFCFQDVFS